jgi:hypothetical protein
MLIERPYVPTLSPHKGEGDERLPNNVPFAISERTRRENTRRRNPPNGTLVERRKRRATDTRVLIDDYSPEDDRAAVARGIRAEGLARGLETGLLAEKRLFQSSVSEHGMASGSL